MGKILLFWIQDIFKKYQHEIILSLVWAIAIIIVNPTGDFPLNDDWAYSRNVYHLSEEGKLILSNWPAMTLIAQVLWGALVSIIFGFSFTVLRFSTLIVGLFTILSLYRIFLNAINNKTTSFAFTILFMFSPLFFSSSFTFMTEVYFLFTMNLSFLFFDKFYKTEKTSYLLVGSLFVLICSLIRQPGIALGIAFSCVILINKRFSLKNLIIASTPIIIGFAGLYFYSLWLHLTGRTTNNSDLSILITQLSEASFDYYLLRFGTIAMYFGFFCFPIFVLILPSVIRNFKWVEKVLIIIIFSILYGFEVQKSFPYGNVLYNLGLGPKLLKDGYWGDNLDPILSVHTIFVIQIFVLFSAVIVVLFFLKEIIKGFTKIVNTSCKSARLLRATLIVFSLIYFGFILINPIFFDRYVLPCIPIVFVILLPIKQTFNRINGSVFGILSSVFILFSLGATHDYLAWNRARWKAINYLTSDLKIEREKIDGGFEFNSWFQTGEFHPVIKGRISWWPVSSDDYTISFGEIEGFKTVKKFGYIRLIPPMHDSISILYKEPNFLPYSAFPIKCNCENRNEDNSLFTGENIDVYFGGGKEQNNTYSLSGIYSIRLDSINPYGLLSQYINIKKNERYIVKVWRKGLDIEAGIVITAEPGNQFFNFNFQSVETNAYGWQLIISEIIIPENCDGYKLGIFLWNRSKDPVWFDDIEINKLPPKNDL